jgi:predicted nucleic acid-binding Zn ribbon protein
VAKKIRDSQKQKLYDAEDAAFRKVKPPEFRTIAECQAYVDRVVGSEAWEALGFSHLGMFDSHPLTVKDGRRRRRGGAQAFSNTIALPRKARSVYYLLHELAHIATSYIHDFYYDEDDEDGGGWPGEEDPKTGMVVLEENVAPHGPEYAGIYLYLVREFISTEAHDALQAAFRDGKVKVMPVEEQVVVTDIDTDAPPQPVTDIDTLGEHCLNCGLALMGNRHKFCSDACRYAYHNRLRHEKGEDDRKKTCVICGVEFTAKRNDAKTCSPRCRQRLRRSIGARRKVVG